MKSIIERRSDIPDAIHLMDTFDKQSPWVFGLEPSEIPDFLKVHHLSLIEDVGYGNFQRKYLKSMGRDLFVIEAEHIVQAKVI